MFSMLGKANSDFEIRMEIPKKKKTQKTRVFNDHVTAYFFFKSSSERMKIDAQFLS